MRPNQIFKHNFQIFYVLLRHCFCVSQSVKKLLRRWGKCFYLFWRLKGVKVKWIYKLKSYHLYFINNVLVFTYDNILLTFYKWKFFFIPVSAFIYFLLVLIYLFSFEDVNDDCNNYGVLRAQWLDPRDCI